LLYSAVTDIHRTPEHTTMPKPRAAKLETATARRRLPVRKKPYWTTISPGIALGYRRNAGAGTWSVRATDGHGGDWIKRLALADDHEPADSTNIMSYWQALDAARVLARKQSGTTDGRPPTVAEALDAYELDLAARGSGAYNAKRPRVHLTPTLLAKPVSLLTATELRKWRDGLRAKGLSAATVNRTRSGLAAACALAAAHDERITNGRAWKIGLAALPDAHRARNVVLNDAQVHSLIAQARMHDDEAATRRLVDVYLGDEDASRLDDVLALKQSCSLALWVEVLAVTGTRTIQAARLRVADLQADRGRVMMPTSAKGRGRKAADRIPVPITATLAAAPALAARGRPGDAPLLVYGERKRWLQRAEFREIVAAAGLDPDVTPYALRHSSIVRGLLAGVPIRVVAVNHDTSVRMIERTYSAYIGDHSDEVARKGLLAPPEPLADNVVALRGVKG
jgi:integrase